MNDDSKKDDKTVDFFITTLKTQGAVVSSVKDGFVLGFKRDYLQALLDQHSDKEELVIFVKRPDFTNAN